MTRADLKPCPFCGGAIENEGGELWHRNDRCFLGDFQICDPLNGIEDAIAAWNRRTEANDERR